MSSDSAPSHPRTSGHLYQGRYKSFAVEEDEYLLTLLRYVEDQPSAGETGSPCRGLAMVGSLGCDDKLRAKLLSPWPVDRPRNWTSLVNEPLREAGRSRLKIEL